jgi:sulfur carrier protein ThiS
MKRKMHAKTMAIVLATTTVVQATGVTSQLLNGVPFEIAHADVTNPELVAGAGQTTSASVTVSGQDITGTAADKASAQAKTRITVKVDSIWGNISIAGVNFSAKWGSSNLMTSLATDIKAASFSAYILESVTSDGTTVTAIFTATDELSSVPAGFTTGLDWSNGHADVSIEPITTNTNVDTSTTTGAAVSTGTTTGAAVSVNESDFEFDTNTGTITGYNGSETEVAIPSEINGVNVKNIGNYAFYNCSSLTSITIPNNVTSIGDYAFCNCGSLASITMPNSVKGIGNYAFYNCSNLTSITIPNNVTSIGNYAFCECGSLTSITIPNSVTGIGMYAFCDCGSLTTLTIENSVTSIGMYAFCDSENALFNVDSQEVKQLLLNCGVDENKIILNSQPSTNTTTSTTTGAAVTVDKTALTDAITEATTNSKSVSVSTDGSDVLVANKWVTAAVEKTYTDAISAAQVIADKTDSTQTEVDNAVGALGTATTAFNTAEAAGTKVVTPTQAKTRITVKVDSLWGNISIAGVEFSPNWNGNLMTSLAADIKAASFSGYTLESVTSDGTTATAIFTATDELPSVPAGFTKGLDWSSGHADVSIESITTDTNVDTSTTTGAAVTVDKTALTDAITAATTNNKSVATSTDGSDVLADNKWVKAADEKTYTDAIAAAQAIADKTNATQIEVDNAVSALAAATIAFNNAESSGTKAAVAIDKKALTDAITAATTNNKSVATSTDGSDVLADNKWVKAADEKTYTDAIAAAQAIADKTNATQIEVDNAVSALAAATIAFNNAESSGTKAAVAIDKKALTDAITAATTNYKSVATSTDGSDVLAANKWVKAADEKTYTDAIAAAQAIADKANATQTEVDNAVAVLTAATTAFNNAEAAGTKVAAADKTALTDAITEATTNSKSVAVSTDGSDVLVANKWVTAAVKKTYTDAIAAAQVISDKTDATQTEVDNAVGALKIATTAFNTAEAAGTKTSSSSSAGSGSSSSSSSSSSSTSTATSTSSTGTATETTTTTTTATETTTTTTTATSPATAANIQSILTSNGTAPVTKDSIAAAITTIGVNNTVDPIVAKEIAKEVAKVVTANIVSDLSATVGQGVTASVAKEVTTTDGNTLSVSTLTKDSVSVGAVITAAKDSTTATIPIDTTAGNITTVYRFVPLLGKYIQITDGVTIGANTVTLPIQANATYVAVANQLASTDTVAQGWAQVNNNWYMVNKTGDPQTGWQKDSTGWFYLSPSNAVMQTGWNKQGDTWYKLGSNGYMQTGWVKDGNDWYYMNNDGSMASNTTVDGYTLGSNGAWIG